MLGYRLAVYAREWLQWGDAWFDLLYFDRSDLLGMSLYQLPFFAGLLAVGTAIFRSALPSPIDLGKTHYRLQMALCLALTLCVSLDLVVVGQLVRTLFRP